MKKKIFNTRLILVSAPALIISLAVMMTILANFTEKINPYKSIQLVKSGGMGGYYESYTFERSGPLCTVTVSDNYNNIDSEEKIIPGFIYYALVFRVESMRIESINGYAAYGSCTDGFATGIRMERKDGSIISAYVYEAEFPDGKDVNKLYRVVSSCAHKDFKKMVVREIKYTKTYREFIYPKYREFMKKYNKLKKDF
ncbi:MAG: hypothetical protein J5521_08170 [Lachnospiraceae bacterium]|nr:hypothetical protein [Lachnospiraceae bacterium]